MSRENEVLEINPDIVFREEDDGAFLFDPDTGRLCYLNELGAELWKHFGRQLATTDVIELVADQYPEMPDNQIRQDCRQFIDDLKAFGFVSST